MKRLVIIIILFLCLPAFGQQGAGPGPGVKSYSASASIGLDATSNSGAEQSSVASISWSHTITTGNLLAVGVISDNTGAAAVGVSGITAGGTSMVQAELASSLNGTVRGRAYIWYLTAPPTGSVSIVVTMASTLTSAEHVKAWAVSLSGVNQTTPLDGGGHVALSSGTPSLALPISNSGAWIVDVIGSTDPASLSPTSPQASEWSQAGTVSDGGGSIVGPVSAGSQIVSWSDNSGTYFYAAQGFVP